MALTQAQKLERSISQIQDRIIEISADTSPDVVVEGLTVNRGTYLGQLNDALDRLIGLRGKVGGPYMVRSYGR